jgi:galactokinase
MDAGAMIKEFSARYGQLPEHNFFCPGRVNLIGEHIDYNGGQVMPCAISLGTYLSVSKNTDKLLRFHCLNFPETATLHLQDSYSRSGGEWFNYPLGVINEFIQLAQPVSGMDMLFYGDLPIGAGLSSSASIEVLMAYALNVMFAGKLNKTELALLGKKAENEFIGVNCGIMDQFAVAMGKKDHAILLNCDSLAYEYLPFNTGNYQLVIINTNKPRALAESKYNERFAECGRALKALKRELTVQHLCVINPEEFTSHRHLINDTVLEKRAFHVVGENKRVTEAKEALLDGNLSLFGQLMYESHQSLKENYEVSGRELDTIVEFCSTYENCIGARMTGAGFGGCAIALVDKKMVADFSEKISDYYYQKTCFSAGIYICGISDGVHKI